jgi:hypothetical protein
MSGFIISGDPAVDQYVGVKVVSDDFHFTSGIIQDIASRGSIAGTGGYGFLPYRDTTGAHVSETLFRSTGGPIGMRHGVASHGQSGGSEPWIEDMLVEFCDFENHRDESVDNHRGATGTIVRGCRVRPGPLTMPQGNLGAIILQGTEDWTVENCDIQGFAPIQGFNPIGIRIQTIWGGPERKITGTLSGNYVNQQGGWGISIEAVKDVPDGTKIPVDIEIDGGSSEEFGPVPVSVAGRPFSIQNHGRNNVVNGAQYVFRYAGRDGIATQNESPLRQQRFIR